MKLSHAISAALCVAFLGGTAVAADAVKAQDKKSTSIPRTADGKPDFSGTYVRDGLGGDTFGGGKRTADGSIICIVCPPEPPAPGAAAAATPARRPMLDRPKYKPEFQARVKQLDADQVKMDPALRCGNPGLPRIGAPDVFVQTPGQIVMLYTDLFGAAFRVIPTDGRPHRKDAEQTYLGDSVGRWEGDTLVIESVNFVDDTWLIDDGAFHTPELKVVETLRYTGDKLEYQATAHDPSVLAEPWAMRARVLKRTDKPVNEALPCIESDLDHIVDGTHHDNAR